MLEIETLLPTTPWDRPIDEQSDALRNRLNAWGRYGVIGLAHSNGGLVARDYVQRNGASSRLDRLATIGTPHHGAHIATNVLNGRVIRYFGGLASSIGTAVSFYANYDPAWYAYPIFGATAEWTLGWLQYVGNLFADNNRLIGLGFGIAAPVTFDDRPTSPFIAGLNAGGSLATEASALRHRVGIATQVDPNGAFFSLILSDVGQARAIKGYAQAVSLNLYYHYRDHWDPLLAGNADLWMTAYLYLRLLDVVWHDFIGAQIWFLSGGRFIRVEASDGFIPHRSSQYPGALRQANLYLPDNNISHTEQKDHPGARAQFERTLVDDFEVKRRPPPPPPPPWEPPPCDKPDPTAIDCPQ